MKIIEIKTQQELDALPDSFSEFTEIRIVGGNDNNPIIIRNNIDNSRVVACNNSRVEAWDNSRVVALGNSTVVACNNSTVVAWGNSRVVAWGNSRVVAWGNSRVVARNNSTVEAWDNSTVEAWDNSTVEAWDNSRVVALGNSRVVARNNSTVEAWDNSTVEAWDNSTVEAWDNSRVVAWGNSRVVACNNSTVVAWDNSRVFARDNSRVFAWNNSKIISFDCSFVFIFYKKVIIEKLFDYSTAIFRNCPESILEKHETATIKIINDEMLNRSFEEELSRGYVKADGIIKKLVSQKKIDEITIFEVEDFPYDKTSFVVKRGNLFSHGKTIEKAIEDLRYKIENRDTSAFIGWRQKEVCISIDDCNQRL